MEATSHRNACLSCRRPMKLDPSLRKNDSPEMNQTHAFTNDDEGLVGESKNLLKIISDSSILSDTPVCRECANELDQDLNKHLATLTEECKSFENLMKDMESLVSSSNLSEKKQELEALKSEEKRLNSELQRYLEEERSLEIKLAREREILEQNLKTEESKWRQFRDNHRNLIDINRATAHLDAEVRYAHAQHKKLSGLHILDACFNIWVDSSGEINGFKLGRLPSNPVEWPEINAAWGQAALLLYVLLEKLKVNLENKKIVPLGSYSHIVMFKGGATQTLPLYGSGPLNPFHNQSLDSGILAFLQCFDTLHEAVKAQNPAFALQYYINGDRLVHDKVEYSAKTMLNSEERWTKAMKMLLANLKAVMLQVISLEYPS
ncbi:unnamed protein product [Auanema sp. JU1783]|nr:unnamed protein product [Auanema sp. JU1783]